MTNSDTPNPVYDRNERAAIDRNHRYETRVQPPPQLTREQVTKMAQRRTGDAMIEQARLSGQLDDLMAGKGKHCDTCTCNEEH